MVKVKEILTKDPGMLEVLNKGWSGAHLSVQRGHVCDFARFYLLNDSGKEEVWG